MTESVIAHAHAPGIVPEWTLGDRMRRSLDEVRPPLSVAGMAEYLGVTRGTVSTWLNGRIRPGTTTLRAWALRTGCDFRWLETGLRAPVAPGTLAARTAARVRVVAASVGWEMESVGQLLGLDPATAAERWDGRQAWPLDELDELAATWGIDVSELLLIPSQGALNLTDGSDIHAQGTWTYVASAGQMTCAA